MTGMIGPFPPARERPRPGTGSGGRNRVEARFKNLSSTYDKPWIPVDIANAEAGITLMSFFEKESAEFKSTSLAAEVALRRVLTDRTEDGRPSRKQTAMACGLLFHVSSVCDRYKDLMRCLLREVLRSVYVTNDESIDAMWDCVSTTGADAFFEKRASYTITDFIQQPLYYERAKKAEEQADKAQAEKSLAFSRCAANKTFALRLVWQQSRETLRRVLRFWRAFVILERFVLATRNKAKVQIRAFLRKADVAKRRGMLVQCFSAWRCILLRAKTAALLKLEKTLTRSTDDAGSKLASLRMVAEVHSKLFAALEAQCRQRFSAAGENDTDSELSSDVEHHDPADIARRLKARYTRLQKLVEHAPIQAPPEHRDTDGTAPVLHLQLSCQKVSSSFNIEISQNTANALKAACSAYSSPIDNDACITAFDIARLVADSQSSGTPLVAYRTLILDTFLSYAVHTGDPSGMKVSSGFAFEAFYRVAKALLAVPEPPFSGGFDEFADVLHGLASSAQPRSYFHSLQSDPLFLDMVAVNGYTVHTYFQTIFDPQAHLENVCTPILPATVRSSFDEIIPKGATLHYIDLLSVTLALSHCLFPLPFSSSSSKWVRFINLLKHRNAHPVSRVKPTNMLKKRRMRSFSSS